MLETYVILPLNKYDALQEQVHQTPLAAQDLSKGPLEPETVNTQNPVEPTEISTPMSSEASDPEILAAEEMEESIPPSTKKLILDKKLPESYFEKCLRILENRGIGQLNLPNLKDLVRSACSRSTRKNMTVLPNESTFYAFIIKHGLM